MQCSFLFRLLFASTLFLVSIPAGADATDAGPATANVDESDARFSPANQQGQYRYLIEFTEPGLLRRQTGRAPGERFDINAPGVRAAQQQLQASQAAHRQTMENALNRPLEVTHHYLVTHSGMAVWLTAAEAEAVARLDGVVSVERERIYQPQTYRGPEFIGADAIWDGSAVPDSTPWRGEGVAIAVLDTGINPDHPSFANAASCPHGGGDPDKLLSFLDCSQTDVSGLCNGPEPEDGDSHGSHTASTAGGNELDGTEDPPAQPPAGFSTISGVAPCAHIRAYRVCRDGCPAADIQAGMDSVLIQQSADGVDIAAMNFSISGGRNPWSDNDRRKLDLVDAGVFVAASAGNTSTAVPNPVGNVNHRGPWVLSVAASTRDVDNNGDPAQGDVLAGFSLRGPTPSPYQDIQKPDISGPGVGIYAAGSQPQFSVTGPAPVPPDLEGIILDLGSASPIDNAATPLEDQPIRYDPGQDFDAEGCNPGFPANFFDGDVALIRRGGCAFTEKINNAMTAGAPLVIIWNNEPGLQPMDTTGQDPDTVAGAITQAQGQAIRDFIDDSDPVDATVEYSGMRSPIYYFSSGTSMSSPHLAGAATLVRQANPDWTVSEVKSAMQMTAFEDGFKEDGTTAWDWDDVGSGRVDLTEAALAGLVMDEVFANYLAADPTSGGDPKTLNLPSARDTDCTPDCSFTRTLRNTLSGPASWTITGNTISSGDFDIDISPNTLNFAGGPAETEDITITVTPNEDLTDAVYFGEVVLSETGGQSPDLHITVAISGGPGAAPVIEVAPPSLSSTLPEGGMETQELTISNTGDGDLEWSIVDGGPEAWSDDFDSYANGSQMHGQGGWKGWLNDPLLGALVTDTQANSAPHAVEIEGDSDLVREFDDLDSGLVIVTAWQFIPGDFNGESFFILLNTYNDDEIGLNWSTQVTFDSTTGQVGNDGGSGGTAPIIHDQWVEIRVEIDMEADTQDFYYNDNLLYSGTWTDENTGGGALDLGAIDLFANGATPVFYDDISITAGLPAGCDAPSDLDWLDAAPLAGTTVPAGSSVVDVTFDASTLTDGDFEEAVLCIDSNDPVTPMVMVPVDLTVGIPGLLAIDTEEHDFGDVEVGASDNVMFTVSNAADPDAESIELTGIAVTGDAEFSVTGGTCAVNDVLEPGDDCTVEVTFGPTAVGAFTGGLEVEADDGEEGQTVTVALSGNGFEIDPAELVVDPETLDFGDVTVDSTGMAAVTVSNAAVEGAADLVITQIEVIQGDPEFFIGGGDCGATLAPQESCTVEVHFSPSAAQPFSGFLRIDAEDNAAVNVALSGDGVDPVPIVFEDRFEQ